MRKEEKTIINYMDMEPHISDAWLEVNSLRENNIF